MLRTGAGGVATRAVSAIALGVPVLAIAYLGTPLFEIMVAVAAVMLAREWFRMCGDSQPPAVGVALGSVLLLAVASASWIGIAMALFVLLAGALAVLALTRGAPWLTAGTLYLGLPCVALVWLRHDPAMGREVVIWLFAVVWAADIGAYAAGRLIGGPRLAPRISPSKTWAGFFGGIGLAAVTSVALAGTESPASLWLPAGLGVLLGVTAQAGDLGESWVKRRFGVKDAGRLIPGHGGLLDRVDALLAVILVVAVIAATDRGTFLQWL